MEEKMHGITWKVKLAYTTAKYDIKNFCLTIKIAVMRARIAVARKAVEVLRDEL